MFNLNCSHSVCVLREFFKKVFLLVVFVINNIPSTHSRQPKNQVEKSIHDNNIDIDDIVPTTNKTKLKHSQKRAKKKNANKKMQIETPVSSFFLVVVFLLCSTKSFERFFSLFMPFTSLPLLSLNSFYCCCCFIFVAIVC